MSATYEQEPQVTCWRRPNCLKRTVLDANRRSTRRSSGTPQKRGAPYFYVRPHKMTIESLSAPITRWAFGFAAALAGAALALHASNWFRSGVVNWPVALNIVGLLVLMLTGAVDPSNGLIRIACTAGALLLILPSAFWLFALFWRSKKR